ncbi:MAG: hypothetical protein HOV81_07140 [Kofleriaceae bacterium]|nr:hypothetical protein [Kofleriaceae bacterium]
MMLRLLSRGLLAAALSFGYVALHDHGRAAYADDEDEGEEDDGGGDDEGGSGDEGEGEGEGEEEDPDAASQPPVTAGGLFTMKSFPVREISRPLTMTQGIAQVRVGVGTDLSAKGAFESFGLSAEGIYGVKDNFTVLGGVTNAYNFNQFGFYVGFEGALAYDVVDFRLSANLHRFAIPRFCGMDPDAPTTCTPDTATLPSGNYDAAGTQFSIDIGFPFRYAIKPEIAIVALQTLMSIDFNGSVRGDPDKRPMGAPAYCSGVGTDDAGNPVTTTTNCIENGGKPDLNPSVGIATNPIPPLSVVVFGQLRIPDFDTSAGNFQIPVTGRVEFSPNQKFDIGLEFTLLNVKPPEGQSPIDNRFLSLFVQSRFGK